MERVTRLVYSLPFDQTIGPALSSPRRQYLTGMLHLIVRAPRKRIKKDRFLSETVFMERVTRLVYILPTGKIMVLMPSSRHQAIVHRTIAIDLSSLLMDG